MMHSIDQAYGFLRHRREAPVPLARDEAAALPAWRSFPNSGRSSGSVKPNKLKILMIPPIQWMPERDRFCSGNAPDPKRLERHLADFDISVDVLDPHSSCLNPFFGRGSFLQSLDPWRALKILFAKRHYDLIISVFDGGALPLLFLKKLALFKTPIALWDVGLTEGWAMRERALNYVIPRVKSIMVLSAKQVNYVRQRWDAAAHVVNVHHYVDANFFSPAGEAGAAEAGEYIFSIGNDHGRDYATFLESLHDLDCPVKIKTNIALDASRLAGKPVEVIKEKADFRALRTMYANAKIVVIPLTETLNASGVSTILEASAMAKPMIVSENTAISDFVIPGETCLQVPCQDPEALNIAIKRLLGDPDLCQRLGQGAQRLVQQRFSTEAFSRGFASSIRAAVA